MKLIKTEYLRAIDDERIFFENITDDGLQVIQSMENPDGCINNRFIALTAFDEAECIDAIYDRLCSTIFITAPLYDANDIECFKIWLEDRHFKVHLLVY